MSKDLLSFLEVERQNEPKRAISDRVKDYKELYIEMPQDQLERQATRCMECGIPFCHSGCPLGNLIPDFNQLVSQQEWKKALHVLHQTNNFPEFTGRLCPAPCEHACVLGIIEEPVTIENIEKYIVEKGFSEGWILPEVPKQRSGKKIAVIGSGPAGLACAQQLNRAGHLVTVYERDARIGGLIRYGVPDFKINKSIIDRRVNILKQEGIEFITGAHVGKNVSISELEKYDSIVLATGATVANRLPIKGSDATGVVQAMHFLKQQNNRVAKVEPIDEHNYYDLQEEITAKNKHVIVIGGGDTGSDCIGTSIRQGAKSITNFELLPKPPIGRSDEYPWPYFAVKLQTSTSHEEGSERQWSILTKEFITDENNNLTGLKTVDVEWKIDPNTAQRKLIEIEGSERIWDCDLALIAIGFSGPERNLAEQLGVTINHRNKIEASIQNYQTNQKHIFTAGDCRRGQSLIVWAISEGREAAYHVDKYLMGKSHLPRKGEGDLTR